MATCTPLMHLRPRCDSIKGNYAYRGASGVCSFGISVQHGMTTFMLNKYTTGKLRGWLIGLQVQQSQTLQLCGHTQLFLFLSTLTVSLSVILSPVEKVAADS